MAKLSDPCVKVEHMAAVFDINTGFRSSAVATINAGLETITVAVATLGPTEAVVELERAQQRLAGLKHQVIADHIHSDGNTRDAEKLLANSKASRNTKRRIVNRAKAVGRNASLGDKLANDELSEEQLDLIADASAKSNGAGAVDETLIADIAAADPDKGRSIKDDWLAARASVDGTQTEHDRQRALRRTQSYNSKKTGLGVTTLEGDSVSQRAVNEAIAARSKQIYKRDGGRDLPTSKHPRTRAQREYDAAYELICGVTIRPDGSPTPEPDSPTPANKPTNRLARPRVVITMTLDEFIGNDPAQVARQIGQIGLGVIPQSVLAEYADIIAALFDANGEPLWLARMQRHASSAQYLALVLRDRGCVLCGTPPSQCDAHHRIPWNAPAKGKTNINELALLCTLCHTKLHADHHTLYQDPASRHWKTRSALPHEIPPARPQHPPPQRE